MFEEMDINDMIRKGRKPKKSSGDDEEKKRKPNEFNSNRPEGMGRPPSEDEIARALEEKFGFHVEAVKHGGILMGVPGGGKDQRLKYEGMLETLIYIAQALKLPTSCKDANGTELVEGDELKVPGGETKIVLKVGWKFAVLSRTDDHKASDGAWFENQMNELNFIKAR